MADDTTILTGKQILAEGIDDWRQLLAALHTRFATGDFVTGLALVNRIAEEAEAANHHPDLDLRYPHLDVSLSSHDVGGVTARDIRLARRISELAGEAAVTAVPAAPALLEVALDTRDPERIKPFWRAVLGLDEHPDSALDLVDPSGQLPALWFQQSDDERTERGRFHLDVHVPHDVALARVAAGVEAGGTLVSEAFVPSWWVLADADGNEVCVCTWQSRD